MCVCVQESKAILVQAKHVRTASAHLDSHIHAALRHLGEQEARTFAANSRMTPEVRNGSEPHRSAPPERDVKNPTVLSCSPSSP